jgi:hypothetical protein
MTSFHLFPLQFIAADLEFYKLQTNVPSAPPALLSILGGGAPRRVARPRGSEGR